MLGTPIRPAKIDELTQMPLMEADSCGPKEVANDV